MTTSSKADEKTTTQQLTPEQQNLISMLMPQAQQFAASNPTLPGASGVAGFDPLQTQGQNEVLASAGEAGNVVGGAAGANKWLTSGAALDPTTNPALRNTISAATDPIFKNLNRSTLPAIGANTSVGNDGKMGANYGGSRQGIAEGIASGDAYEAAGHAAAPIALGAYNSGLNSMLTATGQAPSIAGAQTIPGTITSTVGDVRQGLNQSMMTADQKAKNFADFLPMLKASFLGNMAAGLPGGSTHAVGSSSSDMSPLQAIIGIGSMLSGFMPGK